MSQPKAMEEFLFLFEDVDKAVAIHPPQEVLREYVTGERPAGIDPKGWQSQAISVHLGLCLPCRCAQDAITRLCHHESM